jgi:hypothetical protein
MTVIAAVIQGEVQLSPEAYAEEPEGDLGFGLVRTTSARMPRGPDSTEYLHFVYWIIVVAWAILSVYFSLRVASS